LDPSEEGVVDDPLVAEADHGGAFMGDECQAEVAVLTAPGDGGAVGFAILVRAQRGQVFLVLRAVGLRRRSSTCNAGLVFEEEQSCGSTTTSTSLSSLTLVLLG
jgi:hypothetical protein